ncbi:uncharacterized protein LOC131989764 [Centropristis striata]|uniref:uncharacterized protein LOC131989764 n=1 Tax=Centropristis striata TaxID=184440 RepID=UPI0027DF8D18|nr:uncharacterized protein LOC131989764 [Centropristis striata]XP_059211071.1 uncharacterized protein LOC131989764 [Centropristis striata]XP_059211072.1 uncharacterized protein LOC131989764 [Centropristis striata]
MENSNFLLTGSPNSRESARTSSGVVGNPDLAAGILLGYVFLGLASYIWAFWSHRSKLRAFKEAIFSPCSGQQGTLSGFQNAYRYLPVVFFVDILNAVTAIIWGIELAGFRCSSLATCDYVAIVWELSRSFGVIFHLMNASLCVRLLYNPHLKVHFGVVYISSVLLLCVYIPLYIFIGQWPIYVLAATTFALALTIIINSLKSNTVPSAAAHKKRIVFVAMLTFCIVFLPTFISWCLVASDAHNGIINSNYVISYLNCLFFTSVQLSLNGLLCYFILGVPIEGEEPQQEQPQQHQNFGNQNYDIRAS